MKKKEEPNATKEEIKTENNQPRELTEEELEKVSGGVVRSTIDDPGGAGRRVTVG